MILVAPTERGRHVTVLERECRVVRSMLPERKGCDFLWTVNDQFLGVQRKAIPDLFASMDDGRLAKEAAQAKQLGQAPWLIVEGKLDTAGDEVVIGRRHVTLSVFHQILASCEHHGFKVVRTSGGLETGHAIAGLVKHSKKARHGTATSRPKAAGVWGQATSKEWAGHLLQGFDGIGPEVAAAIVDTFDGPPLQWTVTEKELMTVPGVGKLRAKRLVDALKGRTT